MQSSPCLISIHKYCISLRVKIYEILCVILSFLLTPDSKSISNHHSSQGLNKQEDHYRILTYLEMPRLLNQIRSKTIVTCTLEWPVASVTIVHYYKCIDRCSRVNYIKTLLSFPVMFYFRFYIIINTYWVYEIFYRFHAHITKYMEICYFQLITMYLVKHLLRRRTLTSKSCF